VVHPLDNVIGIITARGGSKGILNKNLATLAGKPLISWTIEAAQQSRMLQRVIVSTDDEMIAETARQWNAEVPFMRPAELAQDDSSHISVIVNAIEWLENKDHYRPDYVMLLQPTSPLRTHQDIDEAIELALGRKAVAVVSVCEAAKHPWKMFRLNESGTIARFYDHGLVYPRRQDLIQAYEENGAIYLNSRESLLQERTFFPEETYPYIMPIERSLDIDTPWDLHIANLILNNR
jgi:CMP-N,N'-diacetyllegionaminic acid synthase